MPWPEPEPAPMTPRERVQAILARLGCLGVTGLLIFAVILAIAGADWWGPASAVQP